jgi:hypothetical protein
MYTFEFRSWLALFGALTSNMKSNIWLRILIVCVLLVFVIGAAITARFFVRLNRTALQESELRYSAAIEIAELLGVTEADVIATSDGCDTATCSRQVYFRTKLGDGAVKQRIRAIWSQETGILQGSPGRIAIQTDGSIRVADQVLNPTSPHTIDNSEIFAFTSYSDRLIPEVRSKIKFMHPQGLYYNIGYLSSRSKKFRFGISGANFEQDLLLIEVLR